MKTASSRHQKQPHVRRRPGRPSALFLSLLSLCAVLPATAAVSILVEPEDQSASLGAEVTFTVTATGDSTLTYQWRHNDINLAGATARTLRRTNLQLSDAGRYQVVVTDSSSSTPSRIAILEVDPTFTKITNGAIVTDVEFSLACAWADYDNDGFLDLFVANDRYEQNPAIDARVKNSLYHNNGDGSFTKILTGGPAERLGNQWHAIWGDYDNDGDMDLFVPRVSWNATDAPNDLYRNEGNGSFTVMTAAQVGPIVEELREHNPSAVWLDHDNDGSLDLFVSSVGDSHPNLEDSLFHNDGHGVFRPMTAAEVGEIVSDEGYTYACSPADYDNDGDQDLIVSYGVFLVGAPTWTALYQNDHEKFSKVDTAGSVVESWVRADGYAWGDYDNDGDLDVVTVQREWRPVALHRNLAGQTFEEVTEDAGFEPGLGAFRAAWGDYDNDGDLDLFLFTSVPGEQNSGLAQLYQNDGDGTFTKIESGSLVREKAVITSPVWVDYDNDGFLDFFFARGWFSGPERNGLYHNNGNANHWLKVKLDGRRSNRSGVGAKVRVQATIRGNTCWQLREISCGGSATWAQDGYLAHFGLGDAGVIDTLRIEWPSGIQQELRQVPVDRFMTVTEPGSAQQPTLSAALASASELQVAITGSPNTAHALEGSSDLQTWSPLTTLTTDATGTAQFSVPLGGVTNQRFYRGVVQLR